MDKICKVDNFSMEKVINEFGTFRYYNENDELHREDGPAIEYADGEKWWFKNAKLHRENGPAIERVSCNNSYYYNGIWYSNIKSDEEWIRFVKLMVFL